MRLKATALVLVLLGPFGFAQDHGHDKKHDRKEEKHKIQQAEIRVYLVGKDGKPVDPKEITATLVIRSEGGKRRVLRTKLNTPGGTHGKATGHGGEVRPMGDYRVEFVVVRSHDGHGEHGEGHKASDASPFYSAGLDEPEGFACSMGHATQPSGPGKCPVCGMQTMRRELKFTAVVIFRIKGQTYNVKGFEYPPAVPDNYPAAVRKIEEHIASIDALIEKGQLETVHAVAQKISYICGKLPALAPKKNRGSIEKTCKQIIALFKEIDAAGDSGNKAGTRKALDKYKAKVRSLKEAAGEEKHGHHD